MKKNQEEVDEILANRERVEIAILMNQVDKHDNMSEDELCPL